MNRPADCASGETVSLAQACAKLETDESPAFSSHQGSIWTLVKHRLVIRHQGQQPRLIARRKLYPEVVYAPAC
jgi:hypothetical protein